MSVLIAPNWKSTSKNFMTALIKYQAVDRRYAYGIHIGNTAVDVYSMVTKTYLKGE